MMYDWLCELVNWRSEYEYTHDICHYLQTLCSSEWVSVQLHQAIRCPQPRMSVSATASRCPLPKPRMTVYAPVPSRPLPQPRLIVSATAPTPVVWYSSEWVIQYVYSDPCDLRLSILRLPCILRSLIMTQQLNFPEVNVTCVMDGTDCSNISSIV